MKLQFSNKFYDVLKFLALYVLPALASLYFGLAGIWGLPYPEKVVGTIMAVDAFLGAILGLVVYQYNKVMTNLGRVNNYSQPTMSGLVQPKLDTYFPVLSNKFFDVLYWIAQIGLPALGTLYFALASIWNLPYGQQVVGTIALLDTFLGILLGINTAKYDKYKDTN
jgi:hypothetical protein